MPNISCDLCGGTDFYNESGYYYCTECQRQTQDIQEHVFEQPDETINVKKLKKVKKTKDNVKTGERITSWECYNYILLGLVNELIELGASENLKSTIEVLWFQYLKHIEVIGKPNVPPKLPAFNSLIDAEIIYGRKRVCRKRRKSRSVSPSSVTDVSTLDAISLKRERSKHKKALARAEYGEFLSQTQQSDSSLVNQSLCSLKESSDNAKDPSKYLQFHHTAAKELKKRMSKHHFRAHCRDVNSTLTCDKLSLKMVSAKYIASPVVLSRSKLFSIIYLGLLINKENIQLGDMLRYIREGHLSFAHTDHFFPEEFIENHLDICSFRHGNQPITSVGIRSFGASMAKFLNVNKYIPIQNMVDLCRRYCEELNLPDTIYEYVLNILSKSTPKLSVYNSSTSIPNYEARAISLILFVLKLLFCLDDATEFDMSNLAATINENSRENQGTMFNFELWLKHIEYRKLVLAEYHFPTKYLHDNFENPDNFIAFMTQYNEKNIEDEDEQPLEIQLIKNLLKRVKNSSKYAPMKFNYSHSLIPYRDYTRQLLTSTVLDNKHYIIDLLSLDCANMSLDILKYMQSYKEMILPSTLIYKHGGKNDEIKFLNVKGREAERFKTYSAEYRMINVTFSRSDKKRKIVTYDKRLPEEFKKDSETIVTNFEKNCSKIYEKTKLENKKIQDNFKTSIKRPMKILPGKEVDMYIYNPSERFWLNLQDISKFSPSEMQTFLSSLPLTFQLLLKECARIIEQSEKDLYMEYCIVETYLSYIFNIKTGKFCDEKVTNSELSKLKAKAKKMW